MKRCMHTSGVHSLWVTVGISNASLFSVQLGDICGISLDFFVWWASCFSLMNNSIVSLPRLGPESSRIESTLSCRRTKCFSKEDGWKPYKTKQNIDWTVSIMMLWYKREFRLTLASFPISNSALAFVVESSFRSCSIICSSFLWLPMYFSIGKFSTKTQSIWSSINRRECSDVSSLKASTVPNSHLSTFCRNTGTKQPTRHFPQRCDDRERSRSFGLGCFAIKLSWAFVWLNYHHGYVGIQ